MTHQPVPLFSRRLGWFTALASLALTMPSFAQSVWTGGADNEFGNGANWSPNRPAATDIATVNTGSPQVTNDITVDRLGVDGGNVTITNTGALTVTNGSTITSGSIGINADGTLNSDVDLNGGSLFIDGTLNGKLMLNTGNVTVNGALGSATVGNTTSLSNNGTVGDVSVSSGGTFTNNSTATANALTNAGTASNAGTLGSLTNTAGNFTNNAGGTITGKTTVSGGTVTNNFVVTDADVAAAAAFVNNIGATAGKVRNSGTLTNAGTIASVQNDAGTFTNNLGGSVTGTTTVSGGSVTNNANFGDVDVGAGGIFTNATGATAGAVANAGNASNAGSITSLTNTAGNFTNNAGGTITGKTTISGGTVTNNFVVTDADVAAAAAFVNNSGATAGDVRNAGTTTNAGTIASLQNDGGLFTNNNGGTVTGTTKVSGGAVVNNATLADVDIDTQGTFTNNSGATAGAVTNAGEAANDGTIASLVNNDGSFSNTGTISGTAAVTGGEFINQGTVTGTIDIFDGGLLSGSGISGGLIVNAGGTLAPGPGMQTLAVNGDLTFRSGSIYQVDIDANGLSDRANTSGALTIEGGTLTLRAASTSYGLTTQYTILTAGSITGTFDNIASDFAFLSPTLTYGTTTIDLSLDRNNVRFADVAITANDRATAAAVEDLGATNPLFSAVLPLDVETAANAFSQLNGEIHASLESTFLWDSQFVREAIVDQMSAFYQRQPAYADNVAFWTSGILAENRFSSNGRARNIDNTIAGALFGADVAVSDQWRLGGLVGYSQLSTHPQASADSYHVGLYAAADIGPLNIVGGTIYTRNEVSTQRDIAFGTFADKLSANYASTTTQVFGDIAWMLEAGNFSLQPFANFAYINLDTDDFRESGGAAALSVTGGSDAMTVSTFGMRWSTDVQAGDFPIVASGMVGWRHAAGDLTPGIISAFEGGSPFVLEGVTVPHDAVVLKAGITAQLSKSTRLKLSYSGEFANGLQSNAAHANLSVNF
ncbi:autotransporter outer membrane beta-barrel domain-containing protein [Agrobacterium sp. rho-13.3]|uniref:autotransporter outer membrane beta-barrel domain-containing protein n=1 Tax=Agrobacterium sp. rho-13.3 TaxID=3072980 RepID=UPI002A1849DA|nr:autotransporter domain-containing protein [Agrobacterium sp. rho-13.3]MDX8309148.1 autotransporter domain-containing protein [Agrobacterium sp. rho-13.3]